MWERVRRKEEQAIEGGRGGRLARLYRLMTKINKCARRLRSHVTLYNINDETATRTGLKKGKEGKSVEEEEEKEKKKRKEKLGTGRDGR